MTARKYKAIRIYEPLIYELEAQAKKQGIKISKLVAERLRPLYCFTCDSAQSESCKYHVYNDFPEAKLKGNV